MVKRAFRIWLLTSNQASLWLFLGMALLRRPTIMKKIIVLDIATTVPHIDNSKFFIFHSHFFTTSFKDIHVISPTKGTFMPSLRPWRGSTRAQSWISSRYPISFTGYPLKFRRRRNTKSCFFGRLNEVFKKYSNQM